MAKPIASAGHQQVNSPKPKRSTPQGDKEYHDTIRRRPIFSKTPMAPRGQSNNSSNSPRLQARSRNTSPTNNAPWCAWCTENGAPHRHSTPDCSMLRNANAEDQWKVLNKHNVCDSCLIPGHHWKTCRNKGQESCLGCGNSHHPNIGCRPNRNASTYTNPL